MQPYTNQIPACQDLNQSKPGKMTVHIHYPQIDRHTFQNPGSELSNEKIVLMKVQNHTANLGGQSFLPDRI